MITMMISIVPSDMAYPQTAAGEEIRHSAPGSKHIRGLGSRGGTERPGMMSFGLGLFRLQLQRRRIDAVAQAGRAGAVVEDVAEMAAALRAQHFGPDHAVADVTLLVDMALGGRRGEARPAAAGIELGVGFEQRLPTASADI